MKIDELRKLMERGFQEEDGKAVSSGPMGCQYQDAPGIVRVRVPHKEVCRGALEVVHPMTDYGDEPESYHLCRFHAKEYRDNWQEQHDEYMASQGFSPRPRAPEMPWKWSVDKDEVREPVEVNPVDYVEGGTLSRRKKKW